MNRLFMKLGGLLMLCSLGACNGGGGGSAVPPAPTPVDPALAFSFQSFSKVSYAPVDRMGQPAIATILLPRPERDRFNATEPDEDGDYSSLMLTRLQQLHEGLDDDLRSKGITPCALDICSRQVVGRIIPDTLMLDLSQPDGFPNGRRFEDITVDRVLSLALADITTPGDCNGRPCDVHSFERVPVNPPRNESPLLAQFPYLAPPHPAPAP